jgi:ornithine carbamoyltransferase|tara:strand:+ start:15450 stop:16328 length:879 start_codon:yes stop_codon:yes gene_type:complete
MNRNFLNLEDLSKEELEKIIENAISLKSSRKSNDLLVGKYIALIFEKSSTRTRVSFEVAMNQLGGKASFLSISDLQLGRGEPLEDTARVIGSMADGVVLRTLKHKTQETFKSFSSSSTINGLSDLSHPCQVLTDLLTYYEENGSIEGEKVCWSGDFNNVCYSYAEAANLFGFKLHVACPKEFQPKDQTLPNVTFTESLDEAIEDSSLVTTDVWVSMGDEKEKEKREQLFKEYQINPLVMDKASEKAIFLHCLPAIRGQEISEELLEDKRSKVWTQAENRLHSQKALLVELLK